MPSEQFQQERPGAGWTVPRNRRVGNLRYGRQRERMVFQRIRRRPAIHREGRVELSGSSFFVFEAPGRAFASSDENALPNRCVFENGTDFGLSHICGPRCFIELRQHSRFPRFSAVFWFHPRPKDHGERSRRSITAGSNFETSPAEALEIGFKRSSPLGYL